jgi:hypothetical protein
MCCAHDFFWSKTKATPASTQYGVGRVDTLKLVQSIGDTIEGARNRAIKAVNTELLKANWEIGKYIVEFEQFTLIPKLP